MKEDIRSIPDKCEYCNALLKECKNLKFIINEKKYACPKCFNILIKKYRSIV